MIAMDYLDRILRHYEGTFDIYRPYEINGRKYPAYGYFFSHLEKYVLLREANLWKADSYEHILFVDSERLTEEEIDSAKEVMVDYMEPVLVRKGQTLPKPDHMYSYLTVVFLSDKEIPGEVQKRIHQFKFEKGYNFNIRGYSQGRVVAVDLEKEKVYTNYQGRKLKKIYRKTLSN